MPDKLEKAYDLIQQYLRSLYKPFVMELGMCDGGHTEMLLSWCDEPTYFGFEPDPRNIQRIQYHGVDKRIQFYPAAMGRVTGSTVFHLAPKEPNSIGNVGASSLSAFTPVLTKEWPWLKEIGTVQVQCYRLDDFCRQNGIKYLDFLWMDVQGGERLVFEGAQEMLPNIGLIWTEYDVGTLYADSSTLTDILKWFPGWEVLADCGGDVLLWNPAYRTTREQLKVPFQAAPQKS